MKNFKLLPALIILPFILNIAFSQDFEANKVLVKFKENSELYQNWLASNKSLESESLKVLLGENIIKAYLPPALLKNPKRIARDAVLSTGSTRMESLSRLAIIEYHAKIEPKIIARKLSQFPDFEYAEPISIKRIFSTPNDPMYPAQKYLSQVNADKAWDLSDTSSVVIVGIVDTGVDYLHSDLKDRMYYNSGEIGTDKNGNDKRTNGIDDDGDGYIDNWLGWDFIGNGAGEDNDPMPGNTHGTHVAGIISATINNKLGIAGTANNVKILPVKAAADSINTETILNGYEAILFAAKMGAKVINCSWGSSSQSAAEQEILDSVASMGAIVVCAAGNDGIYASQYPASYRGAISVAALDSSNGKTSYSNFSSSVDIASPGTDILSTMPGNSYGYKSGTSMASPIVAGVAAMLKGKRPDFSPIQIKEQLKATSLNIDTINAKYIGEIGKGMVDAYQCLSIDSAKSIYLASFSIEDSTNDQIISRREPFYVNLKLRNVLTSLKNCSIEISYSSSPNFDFIDSVYNIGAFNSGETIDVFEKIRLRSKSSVEDNSKLTIYFNAFEDGIFISRFSANVTLAPTYLTMDKNNITATFNSVGNIAFNDFPNNEQGVGLSYKNSGNTLFEGGLIVLTEGNKISDVTRNSSGDAQDASFNIEEQIKSQFTISADGGLNLAHTKYSDDARSYEAGVKIEQSIYQYKSDIDSSLDNNYIISVYKVKNVSGRDYDSLYLGLFLDWDIGLNSGYNYTAFSNNYGYGYVKNVAQPTLPFVGVELISNQKTNFYAIDNTGVGGEFGIYDGFYNSEKYLALTNGIARKSSSVTDVSNVIGGGPVHIKSGDSATFAFAFIGADNQSGLDAVSVAARQKGIALRVADTLYAPLPKKDSLKLIYPNPAISTNMLNISFELYQRQQISLQIVNSLGQFVKEIADFDYYEAGSYTIAEPISSLAQGYYLVRLITESGIYSEPLVVLR